MTEQEHNEHEGQYRARIRAMSLRLFSVERVKGSIRQRGKV